MLLKMFRRSLLALVLVTLLGTVGCANKSTQSQASQQPSQQETTESTSSSPAMEVTILKKVPFEEPDEIRSAVREECQLQTKLPRFVKKFGEENNLNVHLVDDLSEAQTEHVLKMTITQVHAPGGGAFSGAKWMVGDATLLKNGQRVSGAKSKRYSTGGLFAAYKGTCDIVGRCSEAIGEDFATWLTDPTDGARLGDF